MQPQNPPPLDDSQPEPPLVYVRRPARWEYRLVTRRLAQEPGLQEPELNALGVQGWELAGVLEFSGTAHYYFKRLAD